MCYFQSRYAWFFCPSIWTFLFLTRILFWNRRRPCAVFECCSWMESGWYIPALKGSLWSAQILCLRLWSSWWSYSPIWLLRRSSCDDRICWLVFVFEFECNGGCVFVDLEYNICSVFNFLHEWSLVGHFFGVVKRDHSFVILGVIFFFIAGFYIFV